MNETQIKQERIRAIREILLIILISVIGFSAIMLMVMYYETMDGCMIRYKDYNYCLNKVGENNE